ncbi:4-coumarate-CoA ligase 1 isoform X2 [Solenopsis invicta]|uniref:4-coumarate-CoA ligase 1 isoform X2 n=1 Tax=Solenopsis invicta TaxID=13686 RepID=UPI00193D1EB0|nr:4-coumarate-CoA ligase 1 isoform X2 [Solenopsis invicta]
MVAHAFRSIQRLSQMFDAGIRTLNPILRCASTSSQTKIITGPNNEKIIMPPDDEAFYPETLIHEFVWNDSENYPNHIALECGISGKKYTFAQAKDATSYIGRSLRNMGLKKGDVVALMAPNFPETVLGLLGSMSGGLIVTTINPQYTAEEMQGHLLKVNAKAIITSNDIASRVLARVCLPRETPFIVIDDRTGPMPEGSIPFDDLITRGKSLSPVNLNTNCDDVAVLPFSSGTTGLPKGTYQEVIPAALPFFHIYGINVIAFPRLAFGAKIVTIPKFEPETFVKVLERNKVTVLFCVPPMVLFLTSSFLIKKHYFDHTHTMVSAAAPLAKTDVDKFYEKHNVDSKFLKFYQGYGMTESSPCICIELGQKYSSIGKNIASCQIRLVDIKTQKDITTPGQTGELWIKGPHIMKGYLNDEEATKNTITDDGWLKTGDVVYFDEDFDFYITDRLKELIKVKGFQVPPAELEAVLRTHPDVKEAAVIGIPHERYGEVPKAFVVISKGKKPTEDGIKNFVKGKVSGYKQLKGGVTFVDNIPKNPSGKILRSKLKQVYKS